MALLHSFRVISGILRVMKTSVEALLDGGTWADVSS